MSESPATPTTPSTPSVKKPRYQPKLQVPSREQPKQEENEKFKITHTGSIKFQDQGELSLKITQGGIELGQATSVGASSAPPAELTPGSPQATASLFKELQTEAKQKLKFEDLKEITKLGSGASASVFLVQDQKSKEFYASKKILFDKNSSADLIMHEIKSLYECNTPYIIRCFDAFYRDGIIHMIIEYMKCGSLESVVETCGPLPERTISQMAFQILTGLSYLHAKKIVHRDIKPANILINDKGQAKLADFGLANSKAQAVFTTFVGTVTYMSLERIKGQPHSFDSDIWSMALTFYECFVGKFPLPLTETNYWGVMKFLESGQKIDFPSNISPEFRAFLSDCLQNDPKARPTADKLLTYDFITKHQNAEVSLGKWIHENYLLKKKKEAEEKKKLQQKKQ